LGGRGAACGGKWDRAAGDDSGRANGWSEQRVKKLIGGKERYVYLPKPLPVYLEYFVAFVDESGALELPDDVYGYSRRVKAALGLQG
jgi:L,D-transpeptidase YcbB